MSPSYPKDLPKSYLIIYPRILAKPHVMAGVELKLVELERVECRVISLATITYWQCEP